MKIRVDTQLCTGCRTCELMCSFHHLRAFAPDASSIRVRADHLTGALEAWIDETCDGCSGEKYQFCARHCIYNAIRSAAS